MLTLDQIAKRGTTHLPIHVQSRLQFLFNIAKPNETIQTHAGSDSCLLVFDLEEDERGSVVIRKHNWPRLKSVQIDNAHHQLTF